MLKTLFVMLLWMGQSAAIVDPVILYQQGLAALRASNWAEAAAKLSASQRRAPSAMTSYLLAVAYSHQLDYDKTEQSARTSLQLDPALTDQFRDPAARLVGWAQGMKAGAHVSAQFVMSGKGLFDKKDPVKPETVRPLPEDGVIRDEKNATLHRLATTDPCANRTGVALYGCRSAHAKDPVLIPATRLP
jgi:hypothetical protein